MSEALYVMGEIIFWLLAFVLGIGCGITVLALFEYVRRS